MTVKRWLSRLYLSTESAPGSQAIADALGVLEFVYSVDEMPLDRIGPFRGEVDLEHLLPDHASAISRCPAVLATLLEERRIACEDRGDGSQAQGFVALDESRLLSATS